MRISVTELERHCHSVLRRMEKSGRPVEITRRGRVVVELVPVPEVPFSARVRPRKGLRRRAW